MIPIIVCYATSIRQIEISLQVTEDCTIEQAIFKSGLLEEFPEIDLYLCVVGICGKIAALSNQVHAHDRVEIYRPLVIDPKEARRLRALRTALSKNLK